MAQIKEAITEPQGVNTDAVIIEKDGKIIYQYYNRGYTPSTPHLSWSMAKTITGFLIGQASLEYKFSIEDKVSKFIPDFKGSARIIDVLQMSSGINFSEDYFGLPVSSDVVKMLYLDGARLGATEYVKTLPRRENVKPGDHFFYSSGDANLLMEILKKVINNDQVYENYPWEKIFKPLGIEHATFERDRNNIFIGSSYIYMSAPDYLKIGQLIMNNGLWNGKQIIPEFYIKLLHTVAPGVDKIAVGGTSSARAYSMQATTNLPILGRGLEPEYEDLPLDAILLLGHQGQLIVASPSQKLVIVRLAMDKGAKFKKKTFFSAVKDLINSTDAGAYTTAGDHKNPALKSPKPSEGLTGKLHIMDLFKVPLLIRSYAAKEYCSCRFVVGRSHEDCYDDVALTMPIMPQIHVTDGENGTKKITTTFFIGDENTTEFTGEKFGCRLVN
jgi:CubicO group peptidase (beta-lactamase class C family)